MREDKGTVVSMELARYRKGGVAAVLEEMTKVHLRRKQEASVNHVKSSEEPAHYGYWKRRLRTSNKARATNNQG